MSRLYGMLLWAMLHAVAWGQELRCDVTVNVDNIPSSQRDYLRNFKNDLERYLNNTRYTSEDLGGEKIQCTMNVFFKAVVSENRYQAQVFIGSQRPIYVGNDASDKVSSILRVLDDKWEFNYVPNQRMIQDDFTFDALTRFLDFYAYLIIGFDLETYTENSGAQYFRKALNIWTQANGTGAADWQQSSTAYSRFGLADELNNTKFQSFHSAFTSYHLDGIDLLATETQKGLLAMLNAIETIGQIRQRQNQPSVLIKQFFDAKYLEIADAFLKFSNRGVYDRLITADPEHRKTYDDYRTGGGPSK